MQAQTLKNHALRPHIENYRWWFFSLMYGIIIELSLISICQIVDEAGPSLSSAIIILVIAVIGFIAMDSLQDR